ncbi:MAG: hypothetical protein ACE3JK_03275 [Sporolactobacillus sp.]
MQDLDACHTVGEAKVFLSQFSDDAPFASDCIGTLLWRNKGIIYSLTYHYLLYRFRRFISDLLHLDAERLSTLLFITILSWIVYLTFAVLHSLTGVKMLPNISTIVTSGLYASAIAAAPRAAIGMIKTIKNLR